MLGSVLLFAGCVNTPEDVVPSASQHFDTQQLKSASEAFKDEYESLNASGAVFMEVPSDITIYSLDFSQTQEFLTKGTGILYFGFPTCPWCRNLLPELFTTMQKNQISDLYYFNPKSIRDKKTLDEN